MRISTQWYFITIKNHTCNTGTWAKGTAGRPEAAQPHLFFIPVDVNDAFHRYTTHSHLLSIPENRKYRAVDLWMCGEGEGLGIPKIMFFGVWFPHSCFCFMKIIHPMNMTIALSIFVNWRINCFSMLCWFLLYNNVNHRYTYVPSLPPPP